MDRSVEDDITKISSEEVREHKIQENIARWQSVDYPLAPLSEAQMDLIYQIGDVIQDHYFLSPNLQKVDSLQSKIEVSVTEAANTFIPIINTNQEYIQWMVKAENEMKVENLNEYTVFYGKLQEQSNACEALFKDTESTIEAVEDLQKKYQQVTTNTDSLHSLSDQLMKHQKELKDRKKLINERLQYFTVFNSLSENINSYSVDVGGQNFMNILNKIDDCISYLKDHPTYKESKLYISKYENLLSKAVLLIRRYVNSVIVEATKQVTEPDYKTNLLGISSTSTNVEPTPGESAFSLYYGKFHSAAIKIKPIIEFIESKVEVHHNYKQLVADCQQTYFAQRSPVMTAAVAKALSDLKDKHKTDHSILFRSSTVFIMQVCQDEATCFYYFFTGHSAQLHEYLGMICQSLYDILRPSLIGINHLEVLTELCGILRKEILSDQIQDNETLEKFTETVKQLLQDVEERLIFRTNMFFQNDLTGYQPSPGDLAYPEKLEQMENIAEELHERRTESRSSIVSVESQEVANINASHLGQFRSYTGNSPADLHGMWYPTVKRTLVCLSRLYFCLDRETFQGLAQEALILCIQTIENAAVQISARKSQVDGRLFQIKHLLILREQIAPFQVDFTVTEVTLDFSHVKTAALGLLHNRNNLFTFNSNNALLEFLLEGTPKVREYLIDSRKEIDKQLKSSCEAFITHATQLLVGNMTSWSSKTHSLIAAASSQQQTIELENPQVLASIVSGAQRNIKTKIPEIQRSMQLYLANRETEFILFRPIKNNVINAFIQLKQVLKAAQYTEDQMLMIACPTQEQINILICSVSLTTDQDHQAAGRTSQISSTNVDSQPAKKEKSEQTLLEHPIEMQHPVSSSDNQNTSAV